MLTAQVDMSGFNAGLRGLAKLGIPMSKIIRKETGELIKTLVKVSPPADVAKTKSSIASNLAAKFDAASNRESIDSKTSPGGIKWTHWNEQFLYGVSTALDLRRENDVRRLAKISYALTKSGRSLVDFKHPRQRQRVALSRAVLIKDSARAKLTRYIQSHVGRLKAGWMVAVGAGAIQLTGSNLPPSFVRRHVAGSPSYYVDRLSDPNYPNFTIANRAKGIKGRTINYLVSKAVAIRSKAMAANAANFFKRGKNLSDYK